MKTLTHKKVKSILIYILIALMSYSLIVAIGKIMAERTLGSIFRNLLPVFPCLFLIFLASLIDARKLSLFYLLSVITWRIDFKLFLKRLVLVSLFAIPLGLITSRYLVELGLLVVPVIIVVFISLVVSCYYIVAGNTGKGLIIFLLVLPFLHFIEMGCFYDSHETLVVSGVYIPLSIIYLLIILFFFLLKKFREITTDYFSDEDKGFVILCILFIFLPILSVIFSKDPAHSFIYYLIALIFPFAYFLILMKALRNLEDIKSCMYALTISMVIYTLFSLYFMFKKGNILDVTVGIYESQDKLYAGFSSTIIVLMLPFQIILFRILRGWRRASVGVSFLIFFIYLFLSNYRAAVLSAAAGLIVSFYYYRTSAVKKIFISLSILICLALLVFYVEDLYEKLSFFRFITTFELLSLGESFNIISSGRIALWQSCLKMIYDFPLFGIGPDMWSEYISKYAVISFARHNEYGEIVRTYHSDPHNLYLSIWLSYGVMALICYLCILYRVMKKGIENVKRNSSAVWRTISLGSFITLIMWMIMGLFTLRLYGGGHILNTLIFWTVVAFILKLNTLGSKVNNN